MSDLGDRDAYLTLWYFTPVQTRKVMGKLPHALLAFRPTNPTRTLSDGEIHELKRWNTPTIYHGREPISFPKITSDARVQNTFHEKQQSRHLGNV